MTTIYYRLLIFSLIGLSGLSSVPGVAQSETPDHQTPPAPYAIPVEQPDGTVVHLFVRGDQAHHWTESTDGYPLIKNDSGYYEYARVQGTSLVRTGIRAQDPRERSLAAQRSLLALPRHQKPRDTFRPLAARTAFSSPSASARTSSPMPVSGKVRLLAICIDYPNRSATYRVEDFLRLFNGPNQGRSFSDYFRESSYGKLDISVDVVGWTRAKNNFQSYSHGEHGFDGARGLVAEAIDAAEARGVDFSKYDNNNDGNVDGIIIIHSGPGAEEAGNDNYIWSHRWAIPSRFYDGRNISDYMIQPEIRFSERVNIGIFCHEFGHLLGLPDLYDTDYSNGTNSGIGHWGLMGRGGWAGREATPAGLSAWSKSALGWADIQDITGKHGAYSLSAASQSNSFYKIRTPRSDEYFLLENRQQTGVDTELPGSGMAIWHIDQDKTSQYPGSNMVNGDTDRKGVDLEEADGRDELDALPAHSGDSGDLYPGSAGNTEFSPRSYPTSDTYVAQQGSNNSGINLQDIHERNGTITFTYQREGNNVGTSCEQSMIAVLGENKASRTVNWYEFTLPNSGVVSLESSAIPGNVKVYTACDGQVLAQSAGSDISLAYLPQGQRLLIRWEFANQPARPAVWRLKLENSVVRTDSLALVAIYQKMEGARWNKRTNWLQGSVASWEGVRTSQGRVTELRFEQAGLKNGFPQELYQLTGLKRFIVSEAQLSGAIGEEFATLTQLEEVRIAVPGLPVRFLKSVAQLTNLRQLRLADVVLDASLPDNIDKLRKLERLELPNTRLVGAVPATLGEIRNLTYLDLSVNRLSGGIPTSLFKNNLVYLSMHENQLETLPSNLLTNPKLTECYLHRNRLAGSLPREVNRPDDLPLTLTLARNELTGSVPESWTKVAFEELTLNQNQLVGVFPPIRMPKRLDISVNNFTKLPALPNARSAAAVLICHSNYFTFEDLLPNQRYLTCADCQNRYSPQGEAVVNVERSIKAGDASSIRLPFDEGVTTSQYVWYRKNEVVYQSQANALTVASFSTAQVGAYECLITNPTFPGLTLRVVGISLSIQDKLAQTLTIAEIGNKKFGDEPFRLGGKSSADLPVVYQKLEGPVSIEGEVVTILGAGNAKIKMLAAGNDAYASSERVVEFTIDKAKPTIRVGEISDKTYGDEPFALDVKANSNLSVKLTVEAGDVKLSNQTVTIGGAGAVRIRASRQEDQDYEAAEPVMITFDVARASQTLIFNELNDVRYEPEGEILLSATSSSSLPVVYEVVRGGVEVANGALIIQQAGEVTIRATQPGNNNYRPATAQQQTFTIDKAPQEIFFSDVSNKRTTDPAFTLEARSSSTLPVSFRILSGPATLDDKNRLTIQGKQGGEIVVEATQQGNENYLPANPVRQEILVRSAEKENQEILVSPLPDTAMVGEFIALVSTTDKGLAAVVDLAGEARANYDDGNLYFLEAGELIVRLSHPGNDAYNPVSVDKFIVVLDTLPNIKPQSQTLVFGPADRQFGETIIVNTARGEQPTVEIVSGPATVGANGVISTTGTGSVLIRVTHPANNQFEAIDTVLAFLVTRASQQITFEAISLNDSSFHLLAQVPSELPVEYTIDSGEGVIRGDTLVARASGEIVVTARQAGNENYLAADPVQKTFSAEIVTSTTIAADQEVIDVFPNPSPAVFNVRLAPASTLVRYRVVDVRGQLLMKGVIRFSESSLNLSHLASGTYILYLQTDHKNSFHRLLKE